MSSYFAFSFLAKSKLPGNASSFTVILIEIFFGKCLSHNPLLLHQESFVLKTFFVSFYITVSLRAVLSFHGVRSL